MIKYEGFKVPVSLYDNNHVVFDVRKSRGYNKENESQVKKI